MRWKLAMWLSTAALLASVTAQMNSIDNDIHLVDPFPVESDTTTHDPPTTNAIVYGLRDTNDVNLPLADPVIESEQLSEQISAVDVDELEEGTAESEQNSVDQTNEDENNESQNNGSDGNNSDGNDTGENEVGQGPDGKNSDENGNVSVGTGPETEENKSDSEPENGGSENQPESNQRSDERDGASNSNENVAKADIVQIESGLVQGYHIHGETNIRSYIDVPYGSYAGPFKAPFNVSTWEDVHEVWQHTKRCPQMDGSGNYAGDQDCLTLSVFAPSDIQNAPVLLHIYDGQFKTGSADPAIYGPEYLVTKGVILVLPNYRLGPLGFLCMRNEIAPGNAALKDLTLALNWIKQNIESFGGNPSNIVVSADGQAGALAGYLALSPKSRNYISGVITESGSLLAPWAIDRDPAATTTQLSDALSATITDQTDIESLVTKGKDINFRPCIESGEDAFIDKSPWKILEGWEENATLPNFMIGSANHAGLHEAMKETAESLSKLDADFSQILPDDLHFGNGEEVRIETGDRIKRQYFENRSITLDEIRGVSLCYTDVYYLGPAIRAARSLVEAGADVYFYEFSFVGDLNRELTTLSTTVEGAARGDLVGYTFTQDGETPYEGSNEEHLVDLITDLWVTFIQTGKPSGDNVEWNKLETSSEAEEEYLSLDVKTSSHRGLHPDRLNLWTEIYDNHFIEKNLSMHLYTNCYLLLIAVVFSYWFNKGN